MRRGIFIGVVMGLIAGLLAGVLLWLGRLGDAEAGQTLTRVDRRVLADVTRTLSSDDFEGRATGTRGAEMARNLIAREFEAAGLRKLGASYFQRFPALPETGAAASAPREGVNVIGWAAGDTPGKGPAIIVTAHYDHLGVRDGQTYNGADDNASGVASLVVLAKHFSDYPLKHDVFFVAFDGEEIGFLGSRYFVRSGLIAPDRMALNMNLDMVSRSEANELYAAGTAHTPALKPFITALSVEAPVVLRAGHDTPDLGPKNDWTFQSDQAVFYAAGIPFLYFGVEDHPDYHQPTDDFDATSRDFHERATETIGMAIERADARLLASGGD
jgi:Zn-dependent M28 family amino/carboxypeptidase